MNGKYPIYREMNIYCAKNQTSIEEIAQNLEISPKFLYAILAYKKKCPARLIPKLAKLLGKDEETVGLMFGFYHYDWMMACRLHPDEMCQEIDAVLKKRGLRKTAKKRGHPVYKAQSTTEPGPQTPPKT